MRELYDSSKYVACGAPLFYGGPGERTGCGWVVLKVVKRPAPPPPQKKKKRKIARKKTPDTMCLRCKVHAYLADVPLLLSLNLIV